MKVKVRTVKYANKAQYIGLTGEEFEQRIVNAIQKASKLERPSELAMYTKYLLKTIFYIIVLIGFLWSAYLQARVYDLLPEIISYCFGMFLIAISIFSLLPASILYWNPTLFNKKYAKWVLSIGCAPFLIATLILMFLTRLDVNNFNSYQAQNAIILILLCISFLLSVAIDKEQDTSVIIAFSSLVIAFIALLWTLFPVIRVIF